MPPLTPEQQAFAEEHHGLILDFMEKHSLDDDYYGLLAPAVSESGGAVSD